MATFSIYLVMIVVAVSSANPMADSIPSTQYRSSSTVSPHEQQLQKTDYIPSEPYPTQATPRKIEDGSEGLFSAWRTVGRLLFDCSKSGDLVGCLKVKAVTSLGRALSSSDPVELPLPFFEGVSLARDPKAEIPLTSEALEQSDAQVEASLPRALDERTVRLDRLLIDRLDAFFKSRTLQFTVPLSMGLVEGRGKKDKKGGYAMIMVAAMAGMWMQMTMGGMAMMSGKALIVAKIALALAAVCLLKKMGGGGGDGHPQVGDSALRRRRRRRTNANDDDAAGQIHKNILSFSSRSIEGGRGKGGLGGKKGGGMVLLMMAGLKAMMVQSAMGGIAMMSGKALLVAKIALLLALLCCLKKGGGEESKSAQIVYAAPSSDHSGGGGGGWQSSGSGGDWSKRSVTADPYSAYNPHNNRY